MKLVLLTCLLLVGCGDDSFKSLFPPELEDDAMVTSALPKATGPGLDADVGTGGAQGTGGAALASGGATLATGGSDTGGCEYVAHTNGVGQSWSNCTSSDTRNESQARMACEVCCSAENCTCFSATFCNLSLIVGQFGTLTIGWAMGGNVFKIDASNRCSTIGAWN